MSETPKPPVVPGPRLTQDEIIAAIRAGNLQYRPGSTHGNPWFRLLRREVGEPVTTQHGERRHQHAVAEHPSASLMHCPATR